MYVKQGKSNADIALLLGPSEATIKNQVSRILDKAGGSKVNKTPGSVLNRHCGLKWVSFRSASTHIGLSLMVRQSRLIFRIGHGCLGGLYRTRKIAKVTYFYFFYPLSFLLLDSQIANRRSDTT